MPALPPGRLASGRAPPRDHPPPAPHDARRRRRCSRSAMVVLLDATERVRPRRALDRRHALRDPRRAARPEGRRRRRHRRRDVRRAQGALGVLAPDVRPRARGHRAGPPEGDRLRRRVRGDLRRPPGGHRGRQRARARQPRRPQRRVQRHGGEQARARRTSSAASRGSGFARATVGNGLLPEGLGGRAAARPVRDRRPEDAVRRDRRGGHGPARRPRAGSPAAGPGSTSPGRPATSARCRSRAR